MGLIKAAAQAVSSTFHDQWEEYIKCDDLGQDILMKKVTTSNGVISKNSAIQVNPGQIAVIFDSGRILDATAEEGIYTFDQSTSPSFFAGQFGPVFKEMWTRFMYNGATNKEQAVFYLNAKEIIDNKFGTPAPIPFQDWSHAIPNQMTGSMSPLRVEVKCFGKYTFKITDPAVFMSKIAGTTDEYRKDSITEQMRSEVIASFQNVLNELGNSVHKVPVLELPSSTDEIKKIMDEKVFDQPIRDRGLSIVGFVVESVTLDEESEKKIDNYELSSNSFMQQGTLVGAYANAVQDAANNANGSANGFMGIGMMNMASGGMMGGAAMNPFNNPNAQASTQNYDPYQKPATPEQPQQAENVSSPVEEVKEETPVTIEEQPTVIEEAKPVEEVAPASTSSIGGFCPDCGTKIIGRFCTGCGKKLSE